MYDRTFGTDWESIDDREEVIRRAFALGVAVRLGESHPDELDRLNGQIETTYGQSFVNIAYQKGRSEADEIQKTTDEDEEVWDSLIDGKTVLKPPDRSSDDEDDEHGDVDEELNTVPGALRRVDIDSRPDDSTDRVKQPSFLDGATTSNANAGPRPGGERTVFGRRVDRVDRGRDESNDTGSDTSSEDESGAKDESSSNGDGTDSSESADGNGSDGRSTDSGTKGERPQSDGDGTRGDESRQTNGGGDDGTER
ncbi:hypothetical protein ACLI4Z_16855 (plasmid) [Natrialbaceae archaeon A-arb3/5]